MAYKTDIVQVKKKYPYQAQHQYFHSISQKEHNSRHKDMPGEQQHSS